MKNKISVKILGQALVIWAVPITTLLVYEFLPLSRQDRAVVFITALLTSVALIIVLLIYVTTILGKALSRAQENTNILENMSVGIVAVNYQGVIHFLNTSAQSILGITSDVAISHRLLDLVKLKDKDSKAIKSKSVSTVFMHNNGDDHIKLSLVKDNHLIPIDVSVSAVNDSKTSDIILAIRDNTKDAWVDKAKSEFISIASHQLRAPLSTVKWYGELLEKKKSGTLNTKQKNYINKIILSTQRLMYLVDDFLDVSRIESGTFASKEKKPVDVVQLMKNILELQQHSIDERGINLKFTSKAVSKIVMADPEIIREIYTNLITNAVKYNREKGKLSVDFYNDSKHVVVQVADTGVGIPKAEQKNIFSKFFRGGNVIEGGWQGTGLGLYAVKELVEQMGGTANFESVENEGTTFWIKLPKSSKK